MSLDRILVTGATGFVGRHLLPALQQCYPDRTIMGAGIEAADLTSLPAVLDLLDQTRPDCIVHLAVHGGGDAFVRAWGSDCLFQNTSMTLNLYEAAALKSVKKIVNLVPAASYPSWAASPVQEGMIWSGYNRRDYAGYAIGGRMAVAAADAYAVQCGLASSVLIVSEMYGEHLNFRPDELGPVAGFLQAAYHAKGSGADRATLSGDPASRRDLVYVGDVVGLIPWFIENDRAEPLNISNGESPTLSDVAKGVFAAVGCSAEQRWEADLSGGIAPPALDISALGALGLRCPTPFAEGIRRTVR